MISLKLNDMSNKKQANDFLNSLMSKNLEEYMKDPKKYWDEVHVYPDPPKIVLPKADDCFSEWDNKTDSIDDVLTGDMDEV